MPPPRKIRCKGRLYNSLLQFAAAFGKHPNRVRANLRAGWSPAEAVGLKKRKRIGHGRAVVVNGREYPTIRAACKALKLQEGTIAARIRKGYSIEDAFAGNLRPRVSGASKAISFGGAEYKSQTELAEKFGQRAPNVVRRMKRGWTMAQALCIEPPPPRFRDFEGHARNRKWKEIRVDDCDNVEPIPDSEGFKLYEIRCKANRKPYIGITVSSLADRLKQHFAAARRGRKAPLPNAIRKHGEKAFSIHLIRNDAKTFRELQEQEVAEIERRNSVKKGYNSAYGGSIGTAKPVTIDGKTFPSLTFAADYFGIPRGAFLLRLNRLKWKPEEAAELIQRDWIGKKKALNVRGKSYRSMRAAAEAYGIDYKVFHRRISNNWTVEQALGLELPPSRRGTNGIEIEFRGKKYLSLNQLCEEHGIHSAVVQRRRAIGLPLNEAIEQTIRNRRKLKRAPKRS